MSEKEQQTTAAAKSTTTKDNTPARLKIEQEYNDKRSGWQRYYKVTTTTTSNIHCTCTSRRSTATVEAKAESGHSHTCRGNNTHTHKQNFRRTDTFIPFWFDFHENVMSAQKASADADASNTHTHSPNLRIHRQTGVHTWMSVCVCRTATRGQPHCAIIPVVVAVAVMWACVCVCGFWCLRWSATTTAAAQLRSLASSLWRSRNVWPKFSQTHTHTCMLASILTHSHTDTERSPAALCMCSLSLVALGCCCHCLLLLLLPFLFFALSFAAIRSNSDKCGHFLLHFFLHMQVERALCARMRDREFVQWGLPKLARKALQVREGAKKSYRKENLCNEDYRNLQRRQCTWEREREQCGREFLRLGLPKFLFSQFVIVIMGLINALCVVERLSFCEMVVPRNSPVYGLYVCMYVCVFMYCLFHLFWLLSADNWSATNKV